MSPEGVLWREVVSLALGDALGGRDGMCDSENAALVAQHQARRWFENGGPDFRTVCALADLDPQAIREHALRLIHG